MLLAAALLAQAGACNRDTRPVVAKVETARAIAEAILAERGFHAGEKDLLGTIVVGVEPDPRDRRYWHAYAYPEGALGGGVGFRIRRCDGAISGWYYTR